MVIKKSDEFAKLEFGQGMMRAHQLQMASTASFFMIFGHGSPPKSSGSTVIAQPGCPMQSFSNIVYDLWA